MISAKNDIAYKVHFRNGDFPDNGAMYIRTKKTAPFMEHCINMTCGVDDQTGFMKTKANR